MDDESSDDDRRRRARSSWSLLMARPMKFCRRSRRSEDPDDLELEADDDSDDDLVEYCSDDERDERCGNTPTHEGGDPEPDPEAEVAELDASRATRTASWTLARPPGDWRSLTLACGEPGASSPSSLLSSAPLKLRLRLRLLCLGRLCLVLMRRWRRLSCCSGTCASCFLCEKKASSRDADEEEDEDDEAAAPDSAALARRLRPMRAAS